MPKVLCIVGMVVAVLLVVLFGLDLAIGIPFRGAGSTIGMVTDIVFIVLSALLAYVSWATFREQV